MFSILTDLKLPKLFLRRKQNRVILMCKALVGKATIPLQDFNHPYRINRHKHPHTFRRLQNRYEVRDNSRISVSCADGAQSKFVCAIFKMCAPYRYIV